ncbi:hypothetical protein RQP46_006111 [Phenoliferia psychrophenolica]
MDVALLLKTTRTVPHDALTLASLRTAASLLQSSQLVALPTETVYGLGANALSPSATAQIYAAKGRPSDNPLIVHIGSLAMLHQLLPGGAKSIPKVYEPLLKRFWPGPLSLLFPVSSPSLPPPQLALAPAVTAGLSSVAIRMPSHPLALALIQLANIPIAAPSANLSSRPSPTTAQHVMFDLGTGRGLGAILDGGDCDVGLESTVVDYVPPNLETDPEGFGEVRVLRVGGVSAEEIQDCLEQAGFKTPSDRKTQVWRKDFESPELESRPTTPGMKYKHYAPTNARVVLVRPVAANATDATATGGLPRSLLELIDHLLITDLIELAVELLVEEERHLPSHEPLSNRFLRSATLVDRTWNAIATPILLKNGIVTSGSVAGFIGQVKAHGMEMSLGSVRFGKASGGVTAEDAAKEDTAFNLLVETLPGLNSVELLESGSHFKTALPPGRTIQKVHLSNYDMSSGGFVCKFGRSPPSHLASTDTRERCSNNTLAPFLGVLKSLPPELVADIIELTVELLIEEERHLPSHEPLSNRFLRSASLVDRDWHSIAVKVLLKRGIVTSASVVGFLAQIKAHGMEATLESVRFGEASGGVTAEIAAKEDTAFNLLVETLPGLKNLELVDSRANFHSALPLGRTIERIHLINYDFYKGGLGIKLEHAPPVHLVITQTRTPPTPTPHLRTDGNVIALEMFKMFRRCHSVFIDAGHSFAQIYLRFLIVMGEQVFLVGVGNHPRLTSLEILPSRYGGHIVYMNADYLAGLILQLLRTLIILENLTVPACWASDAWLLMLLMLLTIQRLISLSLSCDRWYKAYTELSQTHCDTIKSFRSELAESVRLHAVDVAQVQKSLNQEISTLRKTLREVSKRDEHIQKLLGIPQADLQRRSELEVIDVGKRPVADASWHIYSYETPYRFGYTSKTRLFHSLPIHTIKVAFDSHEPNKLSHKVLSPIPKSRLSIVGFTRDGAGINVTFSAGSLSSGYSSYEAEVFFLESLA